MAKSITIDGKEYIPKDSLQTKEYEGEAKIVILQRGWAMVGILERSGSECKLHNASVIRTWGTTKGLGELADGGPTTSTKLDKCNGLVEFDYLTVVASIAVNKDKWEAHL